MAKAAVARVAVVKEAVGMVAARASVTAVASVAEMVVAEVLVVAVTVEIWAAAVVVAM